MHSWLGRPPSAQELAVLRLLVLGFVNKAIAHELGISEQTVKAHITHLFRKLGAGNRAELSARAIAGRLVAAPPESGAHGDEAP